MGVETRYKNGFLRVPVLLTYNQCKSLRCLHPLQESHNTITTKKVPNQNVKITSSSPCSPIPKTLLGSRSDRNYMLLPPIAVHRQMKFLPCIPNL